MLYWSIKNFCFPTIFLLDNHTQDLDFIQQIMGQHSSKYSVNYLNTCIFALTSLSLVRRCQLHWKLSLEMGREQGTEYITQRKVSHYASKVCTASAKADEPLERFSLVLMVLMTYRLLEKLSNKVYIISIWLATHEHNF